jgi:peptide deformylase
LLKPCQEWDFNNPPEELNRFLSRDLLETLAHHQAYGLAANQVGISYRVMAINISRSLGNTIMFNPELISSSEEQYKNLEGCLSFPKTFLEISRSKTVEVKWQDVNGVYHTETLHDMDAKCFLHELDHLNGRVYKDYVSDLKFGMAVKKGKK